MEPETTHNAPLQPISPHLRHTIPRGTGSQNHNYHAQHTLKTQQHSPRRRLRHRHTPQTPHRHSETHRRHRHLPKPTQKSQRKSTTLPKRGTRPSRRGQPTLPTTHIRRRLRSHTTTKHTKPQGNTDRNPESQQTECNDCSNRAEEKIHPERFPRAT